MRHRASRGWALATALATVSCSGAPTPAATAAQASAAGGTAPVENGKAAATDGAASPRQVPSDGFAVVHVFPHDRSAFTQGLIYRDGFLYESTGMQGQSTLRKVKLETGEVVLRHAVEPKYFAEGLAAWRGELIQLTWQHGTAFVYDLATFKMTRTLTYSGEGWGLTADGQRLIMSDGSATLRFLDPATFREIGRVTVRHAGTPLRDLNELEFVKGEIFANVWHADRIARIDPASGEVKGWVDLTGLRAQSGVTDPEAVLNGIAYDAGADRLFITGKWWPKLYEIRIVPSLPGQGGGA